MIIPQKGNIILWWFTKRFHHSLHDHSTKRKQHSLMVMKHFRDSLRQLSAKGKNNSLVVHKTLSLFS
jgi:hypothetical protein